GSEGHALGFVMTIFQKIAASSFAAVRSTLRRRQLMLTIHEALLKDQALDVDGHLELMKQAKTIIRVESNIPDTPLGNGEIDRILAELKYRLVRKLDEDSLAVAASSHSSEQSTIA
ncbi:MAG: helicase, partial [Planctomyces sp.]